MCEIPWQNIALWLLMRAAQEHPGWDVGQCSLLAMDIEQHALDRGAAQVEQQDVKAALAELVTP